MYNATAYNHSYNDSGLFCIHSSAPPTFGKEMVALIVKELVELKNGVESQELQRAKTQLQSMLLMNLESRPVIFEDLGRQLISNKKRQGAEYYFSAIGNICKQFCFFYKLAFQQLFLIINCYLNFFFLVFYNLCYYNRSDNERRYYTSGEENARFSSYCSLVGRYKQDSFNR